MKRQNQIDVLIKRLRIANRSDGARSNKSRRVRKELRGLGHYGGLRTAL